MAASPVPDFMGMLFSSHSKSSLKVYGYSYSTLTQAVTAQVESTRVLKLPEFFSVDGASLEQCTLTLTFDVTALQSLSATHYIFVVKKSTSAVYTMLKGQITSTDIKWVDHDSESQRNRRHGWVGA